MESHRLLKKRPVAFIIAKYPAKRASDVFFWIVSQDAGRVMGSGRKLVQRIINN